MYYLICIGFGAVKKNNSSVQAVSHPLKKKRHQFRGGSRDPTEKYVDADKNAIRSIFSDTEMSLTCRSRNHFINARLFVGLIILRKHNRTTGIQFICCFPTLLGNNILTLFLIQNRLSTDVTSGNFKLILVR